MNCLRLGLASASPKAKSSEVELNGKNASLIELPSFKSNDFASARFIATSPLFRFKGSDFSGAYSAKFSPTAQILTPRDFPPEIATALFCKIKSGELKKSAFKFALGDSARNSPPPKASQTLFESEYSSDVCDTNAPAITAQDKAHAASNTKFKPL